VRGAYSPFLLSLLEPNVKLSHDGVLISFALATDD
jgi:hypothetical protein